MNKNIHRILSIILSASLIAGSVQLPVYANEINFQEEALQEETICVSSNEAYIEEQEIVPDDNEDIYPETVDSEEEFVSDEELLETGKITLDEYLNRHPNEKNEDKLMDSEVFESDAEEMEELEELCQEMGIDFINMDEKTVTTEDGELTGTKALKAAPILKDTAIPSSWDGRTKGYTTSVKNQGSLGTCWTFAFCGMAESSLIRQGYANTSIDLSEAWVCYSSWKEGGFSYIYPSSFNSQTPFSKAADNGAVFEVAMIAATKSKVPVTDNKAPYSTLYSAFENGTLDSYAPANYASTLADYDYTAVLAASPTNRDAVKKMLMENGGTFGSFFYRYNSSSSYGYQHITDITGKYVDYYSTEGECNSYWPINTNGEALQNHAVELVGWDDNYPATSFKTTAPGNGAWLFKNSWGTGNDNGNGYFWISYYDTTLDVFQSLRMTPYKTTRTSQIRVTDESYNDLDSITIFPGQTKRVRVYAADDDPNSSTYLAHDMVFDFTHTGSDSNVVWDMTTEKEYLNSQGTITWNWGKEQKASPISTQYINATLKRDISGNGERLLDVASKEVAVNFAVPTLKCEFIRNDNTEDQYSVQKQAVYEKYFISDYRIAAEVTSNEGSGYYSGCTFTSSDSSVATVNDDGTIMTNGYGTATITVQSKDAGYPIKTQVPLRVVSKGIEFDGNVQDVSYTSCEGKPAESLSCNVRILTKEGVDITNSVTCTSSNFTYENGLLKLKNPTKSISTNVRFSWDDGTSTFYTPYIHFENKLTKHEATEENITNGLITKTHEFSMNGLPGLVTYECNTCHKKFKTVEIPSPGITTGSDGLPVVSGFNGTSIVEFVKEADYILEETSPETPTENFYRIVFTNNDYYDGEIDTDIPVPCPHKERAQIVKASYIGRTQDLKCKDCGEVLGQLYIDKLTPHYDEDGILTKITGHVTEVDENYNTVTDQDIELVEGTDYELLENAEREVTANFKADCTYYAGSWKIYTRPCLHKQTETVITPWNFDDPSYTTYGKTEIICKECGDVLSTTWTEYPSITGTYESYAVKDDEGNLLVKGTDYTTTSKNDYLVIVFNCDKYKGSFETTIEVPCTHNAGTYTNLSKATPYTDGYVEKVCKKCGEGVEYTKIPQIIVIESTDIKAMSGTKTLIEGTDYDVIGQDTGYKALSFKGELYEGTYYTSIPWANGNENVPVDNPTQVHTCNALKEEVIQKADVWTYGTINCYCSECGAYQYSKNINMPWWDGTNVYGNINGISITLKKGTDYTLDTASGYIVVRFTPSCKYYQGSIETGTIVPDEDISPETPDDTTPQEIEQQDPGSKPVKKPSKVKKPKLASSKKKQLKVTWTSTANAKKYELQYSTSKNFKNCKSKTTTKTSITLKNLKSGKKYYVRVRAINEKGKGKWSAKANKKVK